MTSRPPMSLRETNKKRHRISHRRALATNNPPAGVPQNGRLTNLKQLTVDTTWWTRYRSATQNPDFGGSFENAVPDLAKGRHPAIPLNNGDLVLNPDGTPSNHLQAIASTAGFHFGFIEQGGSSLYRSPSSEGYHSRSAQSSAQHRRIRDHALPGLARQGRQRT